MDQFIGVGFQGHITVILALSRATKRAAAVIPVMLNTLETNVALGIIEGADRINAVGIFTAIDATPRKQAGEFGDGDAIQLALKNVVYALLQIGDGGFEACEQAFGNLAQKHAGFTGRVEKFRVRILEKILGEQIEHLVGDFRWSKDFVVGQIG
jgi:hypothetical protein